MMNDIVERLQAKKRNATDEEDDALDEILLLRQRVKDQHTLIEEIGEELAALKQSQGEPVAWMYVNTDGECEQIEYGKDSPCEGFTPLYTSAPTIPEGWQLVPKEPDWKNNIDALVLLERVNRGGLCFGKEPIQELVEKALTHWKYILAAAPKPDDV